MSQRGSGYARRDRDLYETPAWATVALLPHLREPFRGIWEPAVGGGKMADALRSAGFSVIASDVATGGDFLSMNLPDGRPVGAIITNPPYDLAREFIERALRLMQPVGGQVAMLLRTDYDHAKSRAHLFRDCPAFARKLVLMRRIVWFEPESGAKGKSPSFNHAWFIWDWQHDGPPAVAYGP